MWKTFYFAMVLNNYKREPFHMVLIHYWHNLGERLMISIGYSQKYVLSCDVAMPLLSQFEGFLIKLIKWQSY